MVILLQQERNKHTNPNGGPAPPIVMLETYRDNTYQDTMQRGTVLYMQGIKDRKPIPTSWVFCDMRKTGEVVSWGFEWMMGQLWDQEMEGKEKN